MNAGLPELPNPHGHDMPKGPTPWSNWVIPGRVLAGAYPASLDDVETEQLLSLLLELGVNTFVCLQAEVNIHIPEHSWRAGVGLRPYIRDAQRLLSRAQASGSSSRITQRKIDFLHLPIIDGSVTTDAAMSRLADDCCERVLRGECLYIHCWGGHGRTGTLVAVMLGRLYGLPSSGALRLTQAYHDCRIYPQGVRSPQTTVQRAQVKRLLLLPNPFAGLSKAAAAAGGISSKTAQQQQQQQGSPTASHHAVAPFSPATPAKQSALPAPLNRSSSRSQQLSSPLASLGSSSSSSSLAARNISLTHSHSLPRPAAATAGSNSGSSSSGYKPRLLQHQHTSPAFTAAPAAAAADGGGGSGGAAAGAAVGRVGSFASGSSSGGRQQWGGGAGVSGSSLISSRAHAAATNSLLRADVLRTPMHARLVQPVSHRS